MTELDRLVSLRIEICRYLAEIEIISRMPSPLVIARDTNDCIDQILNRQDRLIEIKAKLNDCLLDYSRETELLQIN